MSQKNQQASNLPKLAAPAQRALAAAGYSRLEQLTRVSEADLKKLHGIGPNALDQLRRALAAKGLAFAEGDTMTTTAQQVSHKAAAIDFLKLASSGQVKEAYRMYIGANFCHHNPYFQGDAATLMAAMEENAAANPNKAIDIHHALEEGDLVAIHACVKLKPGDLGIATIHLFRFEGDRMVELWDVGQPVPEKSPNENGMF